MESLRDRNYQSSRDESSRRFPRTLNHNDDGFQKPTTVIQLEPPRSRRSTSPAKTMRYETNLQRKERMLLQPVSGFQPGLLPSSRTTSTIPATCRRFCSLPHRPRCQPELDDCAHHMRSVFARSMQKVWEVWRRSGAFQDSAEVQVQWRSSGERGPCDGGGRRA